MKTAYNIITGDLIATSSHPTDLQQRYANDPNIGFLDGIRELFSGCVRNGAFVAYTDEQMSARAVRPRGRNAWSNALMTWVSAATLDEAKAMKIDSLKGSARDADETNITVQGVAFEASQEVRTQLAQELALFQAEGSGYSLEWERANGNAITLNGTQVKGLLRAMSNRTQSLKASVRAKIALVNAATTIAQVENVNWP